jgi:hypothetical protein
MGRYLDILKRAEKVETYDKKRPKRQKPPLWSYKSFWSYPHHSGIQVPRARGARALATDCCRCATLPSSVG